jgi:hypothetical protein
VILESAQEARPSLIRFDIVGQTDKLIQADRATDVAVQLGLNLAVDAGEAADGILCSGLEVMVESLHVAGLSASDLSMLHGKGNSLQTVSDLLEWLRFE